MITEISDLTTRYSLNTGTPGFALLIKKSEKIIYEHCLGHRDTEQNPITLKSKFRIASITKQFTAVSILKLIERGELQLDTPITTIMRDLGAFADPITIKHMLTHTSGLPDYEDTANNASGLPFTDENVYVEMSKAGRLLFKPGTAYRYSNSAYCLLALIVTELTGMSYKEYLETQILPLAKINDASLGPTFDAIRVYGFAKAEVGWTLDDQSKFTSTQGDGGIYASVTDLISWQENLYRDQNIINAESLSLMTTPYIQTNYAGESYGFGIAITTIAGETCYLHHGTSTGFENALFYLPKFKISLALLANFSGTALNTIIVGKQIITNHITALKSA